MTVKIDRTNNARHSVMLILRKPKYRWGTSMFINKGRRLAYMDILEQDLTGSMLEMPGYTVQ